jgi:hypothetical protein
MKTALMCSLLFAALSVQPAAAHTIIGEMLRDASINHDLEKIRGGLLKDQQAVDGEDRLGTSVKTSLAYHTQEVRPAASR